MKIVIDIPEEDYIRLRDEGMFGNVTTFKRAVRDGIPLEPAPCEDAISRQAELSHAKKERGNGHEQPFDYVEVDVIKKLPSVKQEPCEDAISRQYLVERATSWDKHFTDSERYVSLTDIQNTPPVKPEQKIGRWIYYYTNGFGRQILKCSKCGFKGDALGFKYCPNCGVKMQGGDAE